MFLSSSFYKNGIALITVGLWLYPVIAVEQECGATQLISPRGIIHERQPAIAWAKVEHAESYRVELESRVPEGKTLVQLDTEVVGTSFRPPQPLTDFRANVTVKITPHCPNARSPTPSVMRFQIDTAPLCALLPDGVRYQSENKRVTWKPVERADRYQVSVFAGVDGALLLRKETQQPESKLPSLEGRPAIVAVRPRCATGWGEPVYQLVANE